MSALGAELREVGLGLRSRVDEFAHKASRTKAGPALVRLIAGVSVLAGLALALPPDVAYSPQAALAIPVALAVSLWPRTRWVTVALLLTIIAWLARTIAFEDDAPQLWRVAALAAAMYGAHTSAALAAVLPYDGIVARGVILRWAARTAGVLAVSTGLGVAGMAVLGQLRAVQSIVGPIVGSVVAAGLTGLLAWHLRRRS